MPWKERMCRTLSIVTILSACATAPQPPKPGVEPQLAELERRAAQLELQVMERDAVIDSLTARLDEAVQEVVGVMGKLRSLASRAEAASAMAEADVALQSIASSGRDSAESRQAVRLMQQSAAEFKQQNF